MMEPIRQGAPPIIDDSPVRSKLNASADDDPRIMLAAERTLLAWIRTGLAMMGFGFLVAKFGLFLREMTILQGGEPTQTPRLSLWIGASMIVLGVVVNFLAGVEHIRFTRHWQQMAARYELRYGMGVASAMVLAAVGILMVAHLVSV